MVYNELYYFSVGGGPSQFRDIHIEEIYNMTILHFKLFIIPGAEGQVWSPFYAYPEGR